MKTITIAAFFGLGMSQLVLGLWCLELSLRADHQDAIIQNHHDALEVLNRGDHWGKPNN